MGKEAFGRWAVVALCVCAVAATAESAQVIYVDDDAAGGGNGSSWQTACQYLQDALALAATAAKPVEIRVAGGVYKPDQGASVTAGDRAATFQLLNSVTLKGGYAGLGASDPDVRNATLYESILSGDLAGDGSSDFQNEQDDSCHVVTGSLTDNTAVMDGLTITGGKSSLGSSCGFGRGGTARVFIDAGSPTIRDCRFISIRSTPSSSAVFLDNASAPVFADCVFRDYDTAMEIEAVGPTVQDCLFSGNRTAVACREGSTPSLAGCRFESNTTGVTVGVTNFSNASPTLTSCTFIDNFRGLQISSGDVSVSECLFEFNGRGIEIFSGSLGLTGCKFNGNTSTSIGGTGDVVLRRCSFTGNSGGLAPVMVTTGSVTVDGCTFANNSALVAGAILGARILTLHNCEFSGNTGGQIGAVDMGGDVFRATNCLFTGNTGARTGALYSDSAVFSMSNCTFADNRGLANAIRYDKPGPACPADLTQCIIWDGPAAVLEESPEAGLLTVVYCDVQGGYPGEGNIDADPGFVAPGYWADPADPSIILGRDDPCAVWVPGDYHVKSQAGHWDREIEGWVPDETTSPCVDAGDPNRPIGAEPFPNGAVANIGAYGGIMEASRSYFGGPVCETQIAGDLNGDCVVDETDMEILTSHWLAQGWPTTDQPPIVAITEPKDGEEFRGTDPMIIRADAADPDGVVIKVLFFMAYSNAGHGSTDADPADGWGCEWEWSSRTWAGPGPQETCTIWAEAMDDGGNVTVSPKIKVVLHASN